MAGRWSITPSTTRRAYSAASASPGLPDELVVEERVEALPVVRALDVEAVEELERELARARADPHGRPSEARGARPRGGPRPRRPPGPCGRPCRPAADVGSLRASACACVSAVMTPNVTGTRAESDTSMRPCAQASAMTRSWIVSPRTTQPSATTASYAPRVAATAAAAWGSSNVPGHLDHRHVAVPDPGGRAAPRARPSQEPVRDRRVPPGHEDGDA